MAVSHVWADGLGNAFENGLPTCQLRMLQTYLGQICEAQSKWSPFGRSAPKFLFWMDTFCIPVQVATPGLPISIDDLNDVKGKAIDNMNIVYSSSSHTLVLDAELRMIPVSADHPTKLAYVQCCGWTTRSWTLQEGCLPPSTVYALADGIYSSDAKQFGQRFGLGKLNIAVRVAYALRGKRFTTPSLVIAIRGLTPETVARCFDYSVHSEIWTAFSNRNFSIWDQVNLFIGSRQTAWHLRTKYAEIWNELLDRSSSQPADTPAIFANLLGVSAYEVLKKDTEHERVALIIRQQTALPIEMLFNTGPRLQSRLDTRNHRSSAAVQPQQDLAALEYAAEESIGLLDMSEPQTQTFKNGWVPARISGERISHPLKGELYLQVFENCLQVHEKGKEQHPHMLTTTRLDIPTSPFVLSWQCQTKDQEITSCTQKTMMVVTRVIDAAAQRAQENHEETVLGHCFLYDPGSILAMSHGLIEHAQGAHLVILSRSEGRLTTRYSEPIRLRVAKKRHELEMLPVYKSECNIHASDGKEYVDILYGKLVYPKLLPAYHTRQDLHVIQMPRVSVRCWQSRQSRQVNCSWSTGSIQLPSLPCTGTSIAVSDPISAHCDPI